MQYGFHAVHDEGVAGIVPALEPPHDSPRGRSANQRPYPYLRLPIASR